MADFDYVGPLVKQYYGLELKNAPQLLHERDGQFVLKCSFTSGPPITLRLCPLARSQERVLGDTGALMLLNNANFPAPVLHPTLQGERIFEWQSGCWGYATEFIEGRNPEMTLPLLSQLAQMLATLHTLVPTGTNYPIAVNWLADLDTALARADAATSDPTWADIAREVTANLRALPDLHHLPQGLIHTDVHEGNLLVNRQGRLFLLDWEDAGLDAMIFDMALVLGWNCVWPTDENSELPDRYIFDEQWCRTFLGSYQQIRPLSESEADSLGGAIRYLMGWFSARDIEREMVQPGASGGLAYTNWAIMRSVTPEWDRQLAEWAKSKF